MNSITVVVDVSEIDLLLHAMREVASLTDSSSCLKVDGCDKEFGYYVCTLMFDVPEAFFLAGRHFERLLKKEKNAIANK